MNPTFVLYDLCACRRLQPCPQLPRSVSSRTLRLSVTGGSMSLANCPISVLCPPPHFLCVTPLALARRESTAARSLRNSPRFACDRCDLSACSLPYLCVYMSRGSPVCLLPSPRCVWLVGISRLLSCGETLGRIGVQCPTATPHTDTRWWPVYAFPQDTLAQTVISCQNRKFLQCC